MFDPKTYILKKKKKKKKKKKEEEEEEEEEAFLSKIGPQSNELVHRWMGHILRPT
jgi:hypothetical protein